MTTYAERIEYWLLSCFPALYLFLVMPADTASDEFVPLRLYSLIVFIILMAIFRSINFKQGSLRDVLKTIRATPAPIFFCLLFILSVVVSSVFSSDPGASWFGVYSMRTGGVFIIACFIIFLLYYTAKKFDWRPFLISVVAIDILAIAEYLGFRPLAFILERNIELTSLFPAVTIGLRQHLAGLLIFTTLLIIPVYAKRKLDYKFWLYLVLGSIALGCTNNTSSYPAVLGAALFLVFSKKLPRFYLFFIPTVIFSCMFLYKPLNELSYYLSKINIVQKTTANKVVTNPTTFKTRLILWESAMNMTSERPLIGWGLQTFNNQWYNHISQAKGDKLFRMELGLSENQKMVRINDSVAFKDKDGETQPGILNYTSSHSALLDLAYSQGILGIALFLTAIFLFIFKNPDFSPLHIIYMSIPLIGYGIYLLAWFITVPTTAVVILLTGILWNRHMYADKTSSKTSEEHTPAGGDT